MATADVLQLHNNSVCQAMLADYGDNHPQNERVILSQTVVKINKKGKQQSRILLLTDKALYNLKQNDVKSCQRRINLKLIESISISSKSNEFVIHVPTEYDYRYKTINLSDKNIIAETLSKLCNISINKLHFSDMSNFTIVKPMAKKLTVDERRNKLKYYSQITMKRTKKLENTQSKSDENNTNSDNNSLISEDEKQKIQDQLTVTNDSKLSEFGSDNLLGSYVVKCGQANYLKTFMWKLRVNKFDGNNSSIFVGIANDIENENIRGYAAGGNNWSTYICKFYGGNTHVIGAMLNKFEQGDYIDLILDLVGNILVFIVNCDKMHIIKNIMSKNKEQYSLSVMLSHAVVELKDFKIFDGSFEKFLESKKNNIEYDIKCYSS